MEWTAIFSSKEFFNFVIFSLVIYVPLFFGWVARNHNYLNEKLSRTITRWTIVAGESPVIFFCFWALDISDL